MTTTYQIGDSTKAFHIIYAKDGELIREIWELEQLIWSMAKAGLDCSKMLTDMKTKTQEMLDNHYKR